MLGREPRVQPPTLDAYSDMPLFNTKAVVHHTGVPAPTLRAWERRYGVLAPRRGENDYRLYSERDMMMVTWLRERVESGMTISQAIALLRSLEPTRRRGRRTRSLVGLPAETGVQSVAPAPGRFSLEDLRSTLLQQFASLDEVAASRTIAQALAIYSVEEVCVSLFTPALVEIGRQWEAGEISITVEHFSTALIRGQLDSLFRSAAGNEGGPLVLVGCAPGELHELGALMLALFLRRVGVRVAYLGQNVETEALLSTVATLRPAGVVLSASLSQHTETLAQVGERLRSSASTATIQPLFCFGGQAFTSAPESAKAVPGHYLGVNARDGVDVLRKRLMA
ncbi:MAG TPA: cobalamin-dependent protein [Ktedonobacterales bacterium]